MTQHQGAGSREAPGGGFPPGTAAVSKHETGTVTKQTTGALQLMDAFALRGGGHHLREYIFLRCALGGGRSAPAKTSTPLIYTIISKINQGSVLKNRDGLLGGTVRTGLEVLMFKLSNVPQNTGCIKARRRCCDAHGRRQTLLLLHSTTH